MSRDNDNKDDSKIMIDILKNTDNYYEKIQQNSRRSR